MKCSSCGKEFGAGTHCQHCGVDRVTGLANYNGYNNSGDSSGYNSSNYGGGSKTTVCFACSEIIPLNSTFCPVCGKKLLVTCPKCGHEYSSQFPVCSKCGTNREEYNERKRKEEEEKRAWEQSPEGKAELAEQKRKEEKEEKERIITYIIGVPILGLIWYSGLNAILPNLGITFLETCNSFLVILICLVLGFITLSLIDEDVISF
jgi:hypothetical protein